MRRLIVWGFMVFLALPVLAANDTAKTKVTVEQLERALEAGQGTPEVKEAEQLSGLELTERLSAVRFARLKAALPGEKAQQSLVALADSAEFLNLPAGELPSTAAPDLTAQRKMLALVVSYTTKAVHQLPNFFATRETTRFEDRPQAEYGYLPLHFVGKSSKNVVFRDGQEMVDASVEKSGKSESAVQGLISWGEFGPILSTVLLDAAQSKLAWSHWERGASGLMAVFGYSVPDPKSHYWVQFCCKTENVRAEPQITRERAGYRGEIAVDPATGAILRMTAEADLPLSQTLTRAAIMVEYGAVEIGGKSFICPRRSVALTLMRYGHATSGAHSILDHDPLKSFVNDVSFEQYHRLGVEMRLLGENGEAMTQGSSVAVSQPDSATLQPESAAMVAPRAPAPATDPTPLAATASTPLPPPAAAAQPAAAQVDSLEQIPTLKATTRAVEVEVVVTDKKQEPVAGLDRQLFEVLEDGKPQAVDYFEEHTARPAPQSDAPKLHANLYTNLPATPVVDSVNVLLIDKLNTPLPDQVKVHQQILDFLQKMKPGTKIAIFVLGSRLRLLHGFTSESEVLRAALNDQKNGDIPERTEASRSRQDDADDQEQADMHAVMMGGSQGRFGTGYSRSGGGPSAGQASIAGNQGGERMTMTLTGLEILARYLAGIQGRKNLIWFASSFPVPVFPSGKQQKGALGAQSFDPGAKEAANLLALSQVAVYPVSAEGMQMDNATEASGYNQNSIGKLYQQADQRAIQTEAVNQLANDSGGKAFYNTNDLAGALTHAIDDGAHYYTLVYTPANRKMDGGFRRIEVHLAGGSYDLSYRRGYFAEEAAAPEAQAGFDPLHALLKRGAPASTQIVFSARLALADTQPAQGDKVAGGNAKLGGRLTRYRINFNLRPEDVKLEETADNRRTGKIQVGLLAYDSDGHAVNWAGGTLAISLSAEQLAAAQRSGFPAHLEIDLPRTEIFLEAGVYDWLGRKAGTVEIPIRAVNVIAPEGEGDYDWSARKAGKP